MDILTTEKGTAAALPDAVKKYHAKVEDENQKCF